MARRRMIDPNIWSSEDMAQLALQQRLLVIGLFSNADDHGKGKANPAYIRSMVFPYDDIPLSEIVEDLRKIDTVISIQFYEVESNSYYKFINWDKWQTVQKPQKSIIPESVENGSRTSRESVENVSSPKERKGKEFKGSEEKGIAPAREETKTDSDKNYIQALLTQCNVQEVTIFPLESLLSFIGVVDVEVIEVAVKKAQDKHINYAIKTLKGMIKDGIKTKYDLEDGYAESRRTSKNLQPRGHPTKGETVHRKPSGWLRTAGNADIQDQMREVP